MENKLTEPQMAYETELLLHKVGLPEDWRIHVDHNVGSLTDPQYNKHELPFFSKERGLGYPEAAHVADPDMVVIDTGDPNTVRLVFEFELDTNPKNLIGVALSPLLAAGYRDPYEKKWYPLDRQLTYVFLLACLERPTKDQERDMAPVTKGELVARFIEEAGSAILSSVKESNVRRIYARVGHDWDKMKKDLERELPSILRKP